MAILTDPDQLDRNQVIFGTGNEKISAYQVGTIRAATDNDGATTSTGTTFTSATATFQTNGVVAGDVLCLYSGSEPGHYLVESVTSETVLEIDDTSSDIPFTSWANTESNLIFEVRQGTGGTASDGISEQAIYSFAKEEWKNDTGVSAIHASYADDLIRYPFPFEPITPTQFEIGGGSSHDNWDWHSLHTKNLIRSGGWRKVDSSSVNQEEYTSFISLGAMDADAQAYYQLVNSTTAKTDFAFTGPVNEAVWLYDNGVFDRRTYFKAFLRKKGKTYASYDLLTEQNLSAVTYKDYSFPLTHASDAAITVQDGNIVGAIPYAGVSGTNRGPVTRTLTQSTSIDAVIAGDGTWSFYHATGDFVNDGVIAGDAVYVSAGNNSGLYYHITNVTATTLTVANPSFDSFTAGSGTETISVYTSKIVEGRSDGATADVDGDTGTLTSATGGFDTGATQVRAGDIVLITSGADIGAYLVLSQDSATVLTLDTSDNTSGLATASSLSFTITRPAMYAQYKWETIVSATTDGGAGYTYADADPDTITTTSSKWASVVAGDIVTISGSSANDGEYTVASATGTVITLVGTDTLTAGSNDTTATIAVNRGFSRDVAGVVYGFAWRVLANGGRLSEVYQFLQHQMRQETDIDWGAGTAVGNITDSLLAFAAPTGTTFNMYIEDLAADDTNNVTWTDATGVSRLENYVATGTIVFNDNLLNDDDTVWKMFFTNCDGYENAGSDYGTIDAIVVKDATSPTPQNIEGANPSASYSFTYDYNGNVQRGASSAGTNAPVTVVAIGLNTAQFVRVDATITQSKGQTISLVSALERNYTT